MTLPTLSDLNKLSAVENNLLILRALNTSDLVFAHMLLKHDTLTDITTNCTDMLKHEPDVLTPEQLTEYNSLIKDINDYVDATRHL